MWLHSTTLYSHILHKYLTVCVHSIHIGMQFPPKVWPHCLHKLFDIQTWVIPPRLRTMLEEGMNNVGVSTYRSNMQGGQPKQSRLVNIIIEIVKKLCDLIQLSVPASEVERSHHGVRTEQVTCTGSKQE